VEKSPNVYDSAPWRLLAAKARHMAAKIDDPEARCGMLKVTESCDQMAVRIEQRKTQSASPVP
jgi:hypothetical protein